MNINERLKDKISSMSVKELYCHIYVDIVTGLQNRSAFEDREPHEAISIIDMDSLKYINDNYGHRIGDSFLKQLGNDLVSTFGYDRVFRLSGDEFVVIGPDQNILDTRLSLLSDKNKTFSYGTGKDLMAADDSLNRNKVIREKCGKRSPRGIKPNWAVEL